MGGRFDEHISDLQRDAAGEAYAEVKGAKEIARKAAAGELRYRGELVPAFEISHSYVAQLGARVKRRREGKQDTPVADLPHRDAIEVLRRRLLNVAHECIEAEEKKRPADRDAARIREWTRCVLEASKLPSATAPRTPHTEQDGKKPHRTTGGTAGKLLADHRRGETAQDNPHHTTDSGDISPAQQQHTRSNGGTDDGRGSLPSAERHEHRALAGGG